MSHSNRSKIQSKSKPSKINNINDNDSDLEFALALSAIERNDINTNATNNNNSKSNSNSNMNDDNELIDNDNNSEYDNNELGELTSPSSDIIINESDLDEDYCNKPKSKSKSKAKSKATKKRKVTSTNTSINNKSKSITQSVKMAKIISPNKNKPVTNSRRNSKDEKVSSEEESDNDDDEDNESMDDSDNAENNKQQCKASIIIPQPAPIISTKKARQILINAPTHLTRAMLLEAISQFQSCELLYNEVISNMNPQYIQRIAAKVEKHINNSFQTLETTMAALILTFVDYRDILKCRRVCKSFQAASNKPLAWSCATINLNQPASLLVERFSLWEALPKVGKSLAQAQNIICKLPKHTGYGTVARLVNECKNIHSLQLNCTEMSSRCANIIKHIPALRELKLKFFQAYSRNGGTKYGNVNEVLEWFAIPSNSPKLVQHDEATTTKKTNKKQLEKPIFPQLIAFIVDADTTEFRTNNECIRSIVKSMKHLQVLRVHKSDFTIDGIQELAKLSNSLTELSLQHSNSLDDQCLKALTKALPLLSKLNLQDCDTLKPESYLHLQSLSHLSSLTIGIESYYDPSRPELSDREQRRNRLVEIINILSQSNTNISELNIHTTGVTFWHHTSIRAILLLNSIKKLAIRQDLASIPNENIESLLELSTSNIHQLTLELPFAGASNNVFSSTIAKLCNNSKSLKYVRITVHNATRMAKIINASLTNKCCWVQGYNYFYFP